MKESSRGGVPPFEGMMMEYDAKAGREAKEEARKQKKVGFFKEEEEVSIADKYEDLELKKWSNDYLNSDVGKNKGSDRKRQKRPTGKGNTPIAPRNPEDAFAAGEKYNDMFKED